MEELTGNVKIVKADYIKDQIDFLNKTVKCKLGISKIHNIGVFAIRNIEKGEKLYCLEPNGLPALPILTNILIIIIDLFYLLFYKKSNTFSAFIIPL